MEADYERLEIVFVIGGYKLIDAESYERRYWTVDAQPLNAGFYVVSWPEQVKTRRFDRDAKFHGPYRQRIEAERALNRIEDELATTVLEFGASPQYLPKQSHAVGSTRIAPTGNLIQ